MKQDWQSSCKIYTPSEGPKEHHRPNKGKSGGDEISLKNIILVDFPKKHKKKS